MTQRADPLRPAFGEPFVNIAAGPTNPHRIGVYIETIAIPSGHVNAGMHLRLRHSDGEFTEYDVRSPWLLTLEEAHSMLFDAERLKGAGK